MVCVFVLSRHWPTTLMVGSVMELTLTSWSLWYLGVKEEWSLAGNTLMPIMVTSLTTLENSEEMIASSCPDQLMGREPHNLYPLICLPVCPCVCLSISQQNNYTHLQTSFSAHTCSCLSKLTRHRQWNLFSVRVALFSIYVCMKHVTV